MTDLDRRLRNGELRFAIEIPPRFQHDLQRGRRPEVGVWLDAAVPFRAELTRNYVEKAHQQYLARLRDAKGLPSPPAPVNFNVRLLFNQAFKSVYAMVPADIMLLLILIPCMLTALSVVREKELGSIANFYSAPATRFEFLVGKQLPYLAVSFIQFASLVAVALVAFSGSDEGKLGRTCCRRRNLPARQHRLRLTDFGLRSDPNGRPFRRGDNYDSSRHTVFRNVRARIFFDRRRPLPFKALSQHLLPGNQRRHLHEGDRIRPVVAEFRRPRRHRAHLLRAVGRAAAEAGTLGLRIGMRHLSHIVRLGIKELISLLRDPVLMLLIVYCFTFSVYAPAKSAVMEVKNASVAVVDEDDSSRLAPDNSMRCCRRCFFAGPNTVQRDQSGDGGKPVHLRRRYPVRGFSMTS